MPKNKGKGKKITKRGRASSEEKRPSSPVKEEDQEYMKVTSILGNCRMELEDQDGNKVLGIIRGKLRKRVYIKIRDLVLVSLRDFQQSKVDIIHRYECSEILHLIRTQEIKNDFVDIDLMFTENNNQTNKKSKDNEIDYPTSSDSENDDNSDVESNDSNESKSSESDLDFNEL